MLVLTNKNPFFLLQARFEHLGVSRIDFSPKEKFLVTASVKVAAKGEEVKEDDPKTVVIHEVATGKRKLEFSGVKSNVWPLFRWSHDDTFFAMVVKDRLQIYDSRLVKKFFFLFISGLCFFSFKARCSFLEVPRCGFPVSRRFHGVHLRMLLRTTCLCPRMEITLLASLLWSFLPRMCCDRRISLTSSELF